MSKLYKVVVTVDLDLVVLADSEEEALGVARDSTMKELSLVSPDEFCMAQPSVVTSMDEIPDWKGCCPYVDKGQVGNATCDELLVDKG